MNVIAEYMEARNTGRAVALSPSLEEAFTMSVDSTHVQERGYEWEFKVRLHHTSVIPEYLGMEGVEKGMEAAKWQLSMALYGDYARKLRDIAVSINRSGCTDRHAIVSALLDVVQDMEGRA